MEAKHTPGPWNVPQPIITNAGLPFSPVCANTLIAKVYSTAFGDHAQSEANARLIAAAPELLEIAISNAEYRAARDSELGRAATKSRSVPFCFKGSVLADALLVIGMAFAMPVLLHYGFELLISAAS